MARYEPTTERGIALKAIADSLLEGAQLPGMLRAARPLINRELDATIAGVDANPEAAADGLRPLALSLALALDIKPHELAEARGGGLGDGT